MTELKIMKKREDLEKSEICVTLIQEFGILRSSGRSKRKNSI